VPETWADIRAGATRMGRTTPVSVIRVPRTA
jgi:hypothetical protein